MLFSSISFLWSLLIRYFTEYFPVFSEIKVCWTALNSPPIDYVFPLGRWVLQKLSRHLRVFVWVCKFCQKCVAPSGCFTCLEFEYSPNITDSEIKLLNRYRPSEMNTFTFMQYFWITKALR